MEYITNPAIRCSLCDGREVLKVEYEEVVESSIMEIDFGVFVCKDGKECNKNVTAEGTKVEFSIGKKGEIQPKKISSFDVPVFEVEKDEEF